MHWVFLLICSISYSYGCSFNAIGEAGIHRLGTSQKDQPIRYYFLDDAHGRADIIRYAFEIWGEVEGSYLAFEETDDQDAAMIWVSGFEDNKSDVSSELNDDGEVIFSTFYLNNDLGSEKQTLSHSVHELGHLFGLNHTTSRGAIMSYDRGGNDTVRLNDDDRLALIRLYPMDYNEKVSTPLGCLSVDSDSSTGTTTGLIAGLFLVWLALRMRALNLSFIIDRN